MIAQAGVSTGRKWTVRQEVVSPREKPLQGNVAWSDWFPEFDFGKPVSRCGDHVLYTAHIRANGSLCLLLVIESRAFRDAGHAAEFVSGMTAVQELRHPNLLPLLWVGERGGHVCLGYSFFDGQPLFAVMDYYRLDPQTVVEITAAMGGALHAGHENGVMHRDFNPGWVLLDEAGGVRVAGVGVMPLLSRSDRGFYELVLGRPEHLRPYVSPEQINLSAPSDQVSDVYALGMITYELLVGHPIGSSVILPSARAQVGTFVDQSIFRALHSSRQMRYQSTVEFARDVQQIYHTYSNQYHWRASDDVPTAAALPAKNRRVRAWLGLAAAAAVVLGAVLWWHLHDSRDRSVRALDDAGRDQQLRELARTISRNKGGISKDRKEEVMAAAAAVLRTMMAMGMGSHKTEQVLAASELLLQGGMDELALDVLMKLQSEVAPDSVDWRRIQAMMQLMMGGIKMYGTHSAAAEQAGKARDFVKERLELARAAGFIPGHLGLADRARRNGYDPVPDLKAVLASMGGGKNGGPVHYAIRSAGLLLQVDVANNPGLRDLRPLRAFPITHLDISGTQVSSLTALAGMPLQMLRLDRTPVGSLAPLKGGPVRVLTAEHCAITDAGDLDLWPVIISYRITLPNGSLRTKDGFPQWGRSWVNSLGLALQPVTPLDPLLVASGEVRWQDFRPFVEGVTLSSSGVVPVVQGGKHARPAAFGRPGPCQKSPGNPATGVTWREAREFCEWLTQTERRRGILNARSSYRLMTSREWDQATGVVAATSAGVSPLAGRTPLFTQWGNLPPAFQFPFAATGPARFATVPSGTFRSLSGVLDLGNQVREWCADTPTGPSSAEFRVIRDFGGQIPPWVNRSRDPLRAAAVIGSAAAASRREDIGFRIVLQLPPVLALTE